MYTYMNLPRDQCSCYKKGLQPNYWLHVVVKSEELVYDVVPRTLLRLLETS